MRLERAIGAWMSRLGMARIKTALNPLLWLCGLFTPIAGVLVYLLRDYAVFPYVFMVALCLPMLAILVAFFIFAFRDPDRLQSEEYQIRHQALRILHYHGQSSDVADVALDAPRLKIEESSQEEP